MNDDGIKGAERIELKRILKELEGEGALERRRKTYLDREEARRDVFDYIEMFYNPKRRHGHANDVSPVEFENQYFNRLQSV